MTSRVVGGFRLESVLGQGAFGKVYQARQEDTGIEAAVKLFVPTSTAIGDFEREVNANRVLGVAPNCRLHVVCMIGFGKDEPLGDYYIITELMDGDLTDFTGWKTEDEDKPRVYTLTEPLAILFSMFQMLEGLKSIHEAGLAHSDIKPPNVLYHIPSGIDPTDAYFNDYVNIATDEIQFKFGDPGFTCRGLVALGGIPATEEYLAVAPCTLEGTPLYMDPFYVRTRFESDETKILPTIAGNLFFNQANDVWGLGQIFRELLFGHDGILNPLTLFHQSDVPATHFDSGNPKLDAAINNIVDVMLTVNYLERPTASALYLDLNDFLLDLMAPEPMEIEESNTITVVTVETGESMVLVFDPDLRVDELKMEIASLMGISPSILHLYVEKLEVYSGTLVENGVRAGDTIFVLVGA